MTELPVQFPIIVGVTGHRDIAPEAVKAVRAGVMEVLAALRASYGAALHVMTGLAEGADQLVAEVAEELGIALIAVAPMQRAVYRETLETAAARAGFDRFWWRAALRIELPAVREDSDDKIQYEQLAGLLARRSHILLALWNGQDDWATMTDPVLREARRGGTGHVVSMRATDGHVAQGVGESSLFKGTFSRLTHGRLGPTLQVATPRARVDGDVVAWREGIPAPGAWRRLAEAPEPAQARHRVRHRRRHTAHGTVHPDLTRVLPTREHEPDLREICELNAMLAGFAGLDSKIFEGSLGYLHTGRVGAAEGEEGLLARWLARAQAGADTAAQHFQRRLVGVWFPSAVKASGGSRAWKFWKSNGSLPGLGVLQLFTLAVPVGVLLFELASYKMMESAIFLYAGLLALCIWIYSRVVEPQFWQDRFQDYRALAEGIRVQLYWSLAGVRQAVPDHYLHKQSGELGWIQAALRGPALWGLALALEMPRPAREIVRKGWILHQLEYFAGTEWKSGKAQDNEAAFHCAETWTKRFLGLSLLMAVCVVAEEVVKLVFGKHAGLSEHGHHWLMIAAAVSPAIAGYFSLSSEKRAYEAHAHSYGFMGGLFSQGLKSIDRLDEGSAEDAAFQSLTLELGKEALAESTEWLLDHRSRAIDYKT